MNKKSLPTVRRATSAKFLLYVAGGFGYTGQASPTPSGFSGSPMDLSKLPKMSQTPPLPPSEPPQSGDTQRPVPDYQPVTLDAGVGGAVWISIAIGAILMLFGRSFAAYLWAKARGIPHNTGVNWTAGPKAGQVVDYWELQGYTGWTDAGIFIFGLAMVLEGIMLAALNSYISTAKKKAAVMS